MPRKGGFHRDCLVILLIKRKRGHWNSFIRDDTEGEGWSELGKNFSRNSAFLRSLHSRNCEKQEVFLERLKFVTRIFHIAIQYLYNVVNILTEWDTKDDIKSVLNVDIFDRAFVHSSMNCNCEEIPLFFEIYRKLGYGTSSVQPEHN